MIPEFDLMKVITRCLIAGAVIGVVAFVVAFGLIRLVS